MPMLRAHFFSFLTLLLFSLGVTTLAAQTQTCPDAPAPRLVVGQFGRVTPGDSNNVRSQPDRAAELVGQLAPGSVFKVLAGPQCDGTRVWWQVRYGQLQGWTVEGAGDDYWLEPFDPTAPTTLTPTNTINYQYENIHFEVDPAFAAGVTVYHLAPILPDPNVDVPMPIAPEGIKFVFSTAAGTTLPVSLRVYPVAGLVDLDPDYRHDLATLREMTDDNPGWLVPEEPIPLLATINQPKIFRARVGEVSFTNGSGFRYLTQYAFDVRPVINPIDYYYSGLTDDGQYYVVLDARLTTPLLADKVTSENDGPQFDSQFETYQKAIEDQFTRADGAAFSPNPDALDALITSLKVGGPSFTVTTDGSTTRVEYDGISFAFNSVLAADVDFYTRAASWETMSPLPEHICFDLQADPLAQGLTRRRLCIYPTEGMEGFVTRLKTILAEKPDYTQPDGRTRIPVPYSGAAQLMHAVVTYHDTEQLTGLSFITSYAQMEYYIINGLIEYNFIGLTRDEDYLIYIDYPVITNRLPDSVSDNFLFTTVAPDPLAYYKTVVDTLNAAAPSDFTPNLDTFTNLIQSIRLN